jgi:hypothetical protein
MLRIFHSQTVAGAILIDDIDDGLPNKTVHRLGSNGDPYAYEVDGYANKPKQPCYVPRTMANIGLPLTQGFINVNETPRVVLSAGKGKISKLRQAGLISVVALNPADVVTPRLTLARLGVPGAGDLTLTGTTFVSVVPDVTQVLITGAGAVALNSVQIVDAGGAVTATSIRIPAVLIPGVAISASWAKVISNSKSSAVVTLS